MELTWNQQECKRKSKNQIVFCFVLSSIKHIYFPMLNSLAVLTKHKKSTKKKVKHTNNKQNNDCFCGFVFGLCLF